MSNRWVLAVLAAVAVLGVSALADALVTSDEERLDEVASAVTLADDGDRLDALLAYADVERETVVVGRRRVARDDELRRALEAELGALDVGALEVVQARSEVRGATGRVALRVRVDGALVDAELTLRRDGQGWLLAGARRL